MPKINHNLIWSTIGHLKRMIRELRSGSDIEEAQLQELLNQIKTFQEAVNDRCREK